MFEWAREHPTEILIGLGVLWSFWMWYRTLRWGRDELQEHFSQNPRPVQGEPPLNWRRQYAENFFRNHSGTARSNEPWDESDEQFSARVRDYMTHHFGFGGNFTTHGDRETLTLDSGNTIRIKLRDDNTLDVSMSAGDHKHRIMNWMALWPFSMLGSLIDDLLIRLWNRLYNLFIRVYQRMSDSVFGDLR